MKYNFSTVLFILLFAYSCTSHRTDLEKSNIKGEVWKIKQSNYDGEKKFGEYQIGEKKYSGHKLFIFNEHGNYKEQQILNKEGNSEQVVKYSYNEDNIITGATIYENGELIQKEIPTIKDDKISKLETFDEEGNLQKIYQYKYSGLHITDGKILNSDKTLSETFHNVIKNDLLKKRTVKDSLGNINFIATYIRNNKGDVISDGYTYPKDSTEYEYSYNYKYDEKNNWVRQYQFNQDGDIEGIIVRKIIYYDNSEEEKSADDLIGIWSVVDNNRWIQFNENHEYDAGNKDKIQVSGNWIFNKKQKTLTLRANDPSDSRKYRYDFEGFQMVLYTIEGEEKIRLEKR